MRCYLSIWNPRKTRGGKKLYCEHLALRGSRCCIHSTNELTEEVCDCCLMFAAAQQLKAQVRRLHENKPDRCAPDN
jgi:hypothetical protein